MKSNTLKKILISLSLLAGIAVAAYSSLAFEETISLNSATTFPVDI